MRLRSVAGAARRRLLCSVYRRLVPLEDSGPFVSFAFDDFPRTAYTAGGAILKRLGFRGTYYVAMGLMGKRTDEGEQFRVDDLGSLVADGHELATQTFSHSSSRKTPVAAFMDDVRKGDDAIREIAGLRPSGNFAYPYGDVTLAAKQAMSYEMTSCRGIFGGVNAPYADLNLLLANGLYGRQDRFRGVRDLVLDNQRRKGWLIFYTHDICLDPSPYGCTPELFESTVRLAAARGARILPVAEVLASLPRATAGRQESAHRAVGVCEDRRNVRCESPTTRGRLSRTIQCPLTVLTGR